MRRSTSTSLFLCVLLMTATSTTPQPAGAADGGKTLTFVDLMKMRTIQDAVIADDGSWVAYALVPDRGDGELVVASADGAHEHRAERGRAPVIAPDGRWVAARIVPTLAEQEQHPDPKPDDGPKPGLVLIDTSDGSQQSFARVERFALSADGSWLARHRAKPAEDADAAEEAEEADVPATGAEGEATETGAREGEAPEEETPEAEAEPEAEEPVDDDKAGTALVLRQLSSRHEIEIEHVTGWAFDDVGHGLAYAVATPSGDGNGVFLLDLDDLETPAVTIAATDRAHYHALTWSHEPHDHLAFVTAPPRPDAEEPGAREDTGSEENTGADETSTDRPSAEETPLAPPPAALWIWRGDARTGARITASEDAPEDWYLPAENELVWSRDAERLFFGYRLRNEWQPPDDKEDETKNDADGDGPSVDDFDPFDFDGILEKKTLDVWHWNDPLIMTNQRERWEEEQKHLFRAVYHLPSAGEASAGKGATSPAGGQIVPLADRALRRVATSNNPRAVLGRSEAPYFRERTWDGFYFDVYRVSLLDGTRRQVAARVEEDASLSPDGRYVAYYRAPDWYLWDSRDGSTRNLTEALGVPFANEDHDYPRDASGYDVADWLEDSSAVLINDKYDIWRLPTGEGEPRRLTGGDGRQQQMVYRLLDLDPDREFVRADERLLLSGYHDRLKHRGFFRALASDDTIAPIMPGEGETLRLVSRAKDADRLLFTRERYDQFPDLWTAMADLEAPRQLSDANPQIADFAWGKAELVDWRDLDGRETQGILIKPGNYQPGRRYPVLVYFYRLFSQRLHLFNDPRVNHRPSFPVYASDEYAVFLPDVRFEIGRPGFSATKALVPGVQKLIDMGIADPDAIGLHGHSWSGYQTAFMITQTHQFKAAVAGAPVSNMTSAYSGIRWGTGLARQFQYEQGQSRIGGNLWEARDEYIDNSPVFFADRIETPLLIMFGDQDDAVPWYQGIELYLAMRRLGKDAIFLQYRGEPHHLKQYGNKLDYALKMKAFFDHHLKGAPAPEWMTKGVPYQGD